MGRGLNRNSEQTLQSLRNSVPANAQHICSGFIIHPVAGRVNRSNLHLSTQWIMVEVRDVSVGTNNVS